MIIVVISTGHARTPSGCKSGDIKRTIIKKLGLLPARTRMRKAESSLRCLRASISMRCACLAECQNRDR
jgi:hypothetical protein